MARSLFLMALTCMMAFCAASSATRVLLATGDGDSVAVRSRNFASLAAHKQPIAPRTPAKSFELRTASGKHLLNALSTDTTATRELLATGDGDSVAARSRNFASLAAHKQPTAPRMPVKSFERRTASGKHLLNALSTDTTATRELLAAGDGDSVAARSRNFASLAAHKQPTAPRTPVKTFERRTASGKHLLNALSTDTTATRVLLATGDGDSVAARSSNFASLAAHKQPTAPRMPVKSFERRTAPQAGK